MVYRPIISQHAESIRLVESRMGTYCMIFGGFSFDFFDQILVNSRWFRQKINHVMTFNKIYKFLSMQFPSCCPMRIILATNWTHFWLVKEVLFRIGSRIVRMEAQKFRSTEKFVGWICFREPRKCLNEIFLHGMKTSRLRANYAWDTICHTRYV